MFRVDGPGICECGSNFESYCLRPCLLRAGTSFADTQQRTAVFTNRVSRIVLETALGTLDQLRSPGMGVDEIRLLVRGCPGRTR